MVNAVVNPEHDFSPGARVSDSGRTRLSGPQVAKGMTVGELRAKLRPQEQMDVVQFDSAASNAEFVFDGKMKFRFAGQEFTMKKAAYVKLGAMLGVPAPYMGKAPFDIMVPHLNYWLKNGPQKQIGFGAVDGKIEVFTKGEMSPISNYRVLDVVEEVMGSDLTVRHVSNDLFHTNFSVLAAEAATNRYERKVGDVVRTGVTIDNSYAMSSPLAISAYVERLICSNGAISTHNVFRASRRGYYEGSDDWMKQAMESAVSAATFEIEQLRALPEIRFNGHLSDTLQSIFTDFSIPTKVRQIFTDRAVDSGIESMQDLYDLITDIASNNAEILADAALSRRLMRVGGQISGHPEMCDSCHRIKH